MEEGGRRRESEEDVMIIYEFIEMQAGFKDKGRVMHQGMQVTSSSWKG